MSKQKKRSDILHVSPRLETEKIELIVKKLKAHKDMPIKDLQGELKDHYKTIADYSSLLYGTKSYKQFTDIIKNTFHDVKTYKHNTVGSYLNGCNVQHNMKNSVGCNPLCAGSIPSHHEEKSNGSWSWNPSSSGHNHICHRLVMVAEWKGNHFEFVDMNESTHLHEAYIYTHFKSMEEFPGFDKREKQQLEKYGINKVDLIYHCEHSHNYTSLTGGFLELCDIKDRTGKSGHNHNGNNSNNGNNNSSSSSSSGWIWGLVILIIIIIILLLIWNNRRNTVVVY
jgi:hypothetical protein